MILSTANPCYTFCVFNSAGVAEDSVTVTATSSSGTCYGGWGYAGLVDSQLCGIYNDTKSVILIIGLLLMVLGGALYGAWHILPSQGRGTVTGYEMNMVLGGLVAIVISVLAPWIFSVMTSGATVAC